MTPKSVSKLAAWALPPSREPDSSWTTTGTVRVGRNGTGTLNVSSGASVTATTFLVGALGKLQGDGTVIGAVQNGGIVAPGNSPGALHITGNYTQTAIGQLQIEIAGAAPALNTISCLSRARSCSTARSM